MPEAAGQGVERGVTKGERDGCAELQEAALAEGEGKTGANCASPTLGAGAPTGPSRAARECCFRTEWETSCVSV